jgi:stage II sporulation protein D
VKRGLIAIVLAVAAAVGCRSGAISPQLPQAADAVVPNLLRVQYVESGLSVVRAVPLEDYVLATAISEFAPAAGDPATVERMYEVQAIISRTYAVAQLGRHARDGFDVCATTHCQLYEPARIGTSRWSAIAARAVQKTAGMVIAFDGVPARALFHADCGGFTSDAASVWGGDNLPYLVAHRDERVSDDVHARWEYQVSVDAVVRTLKGDPRTKLDGTFQSLDVTTRDVAGRAERVVIRSRAANGVVKTLDVRGEELRQVLAAAFGARTIKSTRFDVQRSGSTLTFSGRGFGHGVGLCQAGALARLQGGTMPADVIKYYYPGTRLETSRTHRISVTTASRAISSLEPGTPGR